jgi:hypothetical protein
MIISLLLISLSFGWTCSVQTLGRMEPFCTYERTTNRLDCFEFASFKDLDFSQIRVNPSTVNLEPKPELRLKLDSDLNFNGLIMDWIPQEGNTLPPKIIIKNIFGFNQFFNPFDLVKFQDNINKLFQIEIHDSEFNFEMNFTCLVDQLNKNDSYIFSNLNLDTLLIQDSIYFSNSSLCPSYFRGSRIQKFIFNGLDRVYYSELQSEFDSETTKNILDTRVASLSLKFGYDNFLTELNNKNLLNEFIFSEIKELELNFVSIKKIDQYTFKNFTSLSSFKILNYDLERLFESGLEWMKFLNPKR